MDEPRLIGLARAGSEDAVRELFRRYWHVAWQWGYAVVGDRMLADQAAQEAIVQAFRSLDRFDPERPFGPWLKRIVVNRAIDELRGERRRQPPESWMLDLRAAAVLEEDAELVDAVVEGLRDLPQSQRTALVLHYWLDLKVEEISSLLRVPAGTVVSRLSRARAALRERVEQEHGV